MPGILDQLLRQDQKRKQEEIAKFMSSVQAAGSRERALDVVKNFSDRFETPKDFTTAFSVVDEFYPEPSKEVRPVTVFSRETGEASQRFVPSGELVSLEDPAEVERRFGPGSTLTKPDLETFFRMPDEKGRTEVLGRFPISRRPEGAVTLQELESERRVRSEEAQRKRDELSTKRFERLLGQMAETGVSKDVARGRSVINDATRLTAMMLGGKFEDGIWIFDDRDMEKLFASRIRFIEEAIRVEPKILDRAVGGIELFNRADKALPVSEAERPEPEKPPAKPEPSLASKGFEFVKGKVKDALKGEQRSKPAEGRVTTPAQQISAKAAEIKARRDLTPEQRDAALKRLREIATREKIKVEF